jgi:hypothetical protein
MYTPAKVKMVSPRAPKALLFKKMNIVILSYDDRSGGIL